LGIPLVACCGDDGDQAGPSERLPFNLTPSGEPVDPEDYHPLQGDEDRRQELQNRLDINSFGRPPVTDEIREGVVNIQVDVEKKIEEALLSDGYSRDSLYANRHRIRGFLFYPRGMPLTKGTYEKDLNQIETYGTHRSPLYNRIMDALEDGHIFLEHRAIKKDPPV
jgi:hypothetical protein